MKFKLLISSVVLIVNILNAQNKGGYTWVWGNGTYITIFDGSTNKPILNQLASLSNPGPYYANYSKGSSIICDSSSGKLLFSSNGFQLIDSSGLVVENGDSLVGKKYYEHYANIKASSITQGSIILPRKNNTFYLFTPTLTDSLFDYWQTNPFGDGRAEFNLLQYHIVDMQANAGHGKVIQKNIPLIKDNRMSFVGMMACRHANGKDWWLLKQVYHDNFDNKVYVFLVTEDTVIYHHSQEFFGPHFGTHGNYGQSCFSADGSKYACVMGVDKKMFLSDFNRCTGMLSNAKSIKVPIDSSGHIYDISINRWDSVLGGICFSPNDSFIYINRWWNIYQYEWQNPDSAAAWVRIKRDGDTSYFLYHEEFGQMQRGADNRIYIGKVGESLNQNSTIDNPNAKGLACSFCAKCWRYDAGLGGTSSPPNVPDFNLGVDSSLCWPVSNMQLAMSNEQLKVYPNPAFNELRIENGKLKTKELYNYTGQLLLTTTENKIDVSKYRRGLYFVKCGAEVIKVLLE